MSPSGTTEPDGAGGRCLSCSSELAHDNPGSLCSPCQTSSRGRPPTAPDLPSEFWEHHDLRRALDDRHMGHVIKAYRRHPWHGSRRVRQEEVGAWAGVDQPQVSKIENGPPIMHLDKLVFWAGLLRIPPDLLWFTLPEDNQHQRQEDNTRGTGAHVAPRRQQRHDDLGSTSSLSAADVAVIRDMLDAFTASDRQFGGAHARAQATDYLHQVVRPRLHARTDGDVARGLFGVATEFALRVASMQLDAGRADVSRQLLALAGGFADQTEDLTLTAWALTRRGEQHLYEEHVDHAVAYTAAGAALAAKAPAAVQSFLVGKQALALARRGDKAGTLRLLGQVQEAFTKTSGADGPTWMGNYGWGHIRHDEALCYTHLEMGTEAVAAVEESMAVQGRSRFARPRAFSLGVLAIGHAQAGEVEMACTIAHELVGIATHLTSNRVRTRLVDVLHALDAYGQMPVVRDLHEAARPVLTRVSA
jgi:transcriptional regulator with XRE-family HTH domain